MRELIINALNLVRVILGVVFVFSVISAYRHYNRGDMFDGHAHFRTLVWAALISLLLIAGFSAFLVTLV